MTASRRVNNLDSVTNADTRQEKLDVGVWDRLVQERVGQPLRPERLRTLLVIVPAASGDVALATTLIRHVKQINPDCRVSFATEKANLRLAALCPGIDETLEMPQTPRGEMSRRKCLAEYSGRADAVVYTNWWREDVDLASDYHLNMLESIWLLGGVTGGMPSQPQRVWLETTRMPSEAAAVIARAFDHSARMRLISESGKRLRGSTRQAAPRHLLHSLRSIAEIVRPIHRRRLNRGALGREFVILSTEARSVPEPAKGVVKAIVRMLRQDGRTVLHNVIDPIHAAPGTIPLKCSYEEFLCLRQAGIPFVGWRSGLCDIAAAAPAPMCVFYPTEAHPLEREWCPDIRAIFGFNAMNIKADCLEVVCGSVEDVLRSNFPNHLPIKD